MDYNLELKHLYEKYKAKWNGELKKGELSAELVRQLSCPLLLHVENEQWENSKRRILLVGQECFGWDNGKGGNLQSLANFLSISDSVSTMQDVYEGFDFGATYSRSPFWQEYNQIRHEAESDRSYSVLWTNLYRCC